MLTKKQEQMLNFLISFKNRYGYYPTIREICTHLKLSSTASAKKMLDRLEEKGVIRRGHGKARLIEIVNHTHKKGIPVLGKVAAGYPILSEENILTYINLEKFLDTDKYFFLKVTGDSMIEKKIFDEDLVLVELTKELKNGDIGVFRLNGEVTVKTYYYNRNSIILKPENPFYENIIVEETDDFEIIGKVVFIMRNI
ncbi:SOS-response transcriptional repressor [Deferribacter desulfuricans SSM1]|uniref:SOS-response transcriptional repressor n=1 Tax=Deferribacter desulfuricans (strain DSM 14783 / JCM 11476 / NBRC 101012 / SSM1) TaxID=639282 RepID=D3PBJ7_DEFDS|nr:transcriptional repressor LexA [Deferribacter desulfuricans]BAI79970.1 SOS-response transcriptional repressor [Deferribacter desulfuricans SSM1]